ncbi:thioesterase family protein [Actinomycetospora straminea]|uniref:Thioesterase family protein n=1 Tax=Actinomycetospora straminea TaxID=663607 RepID=A0ABP9DSA8_9PSEU
MTALVTEPFFRLLPPVADDPPGTQRVLATGSTAGPWFPDGQHMGPPSALLVRALEQCAPREEMLLSRLTVEVLGRVPMGELTVSARVERAGRTIELVVAELAAAGRAVARAAGWRLAVTDTAAAATAPGPSMPGPEEGRAIPSPAGWLPGYLDAIDWRWLEGHLGESGPGRAWGRLRVPVVEGEEPTPWQRLASIADSTNGAAARLDLNDWLFVNTDLTLHVHRAPRGEWIGLDADSVIGPEGLGTAFSVLHDEHGPVGRAAQALTVRPR